MPIDESHEIALEANRAKLASEFLEKIDPKKGPKMDPILDQKMVQNLTKKWTQFWTKKWSKIGVRPASSIEVYWRRQ